MHSCIRTKNFDSDEAFKFRGRAYSLIKKWKNTATDLRQACDISFDEQTDERLKTITPNVKKIELHKLKEKRKKNEKEEREN